VVPNAASARFAPCTDPVELWRVRTKYGIQGDYILSVGTLQPRKNLPRLIEAFIEARKRPGFDCRLVLVGKKGWGPDEAKALPAGVLQRKDVIFTGYVEDEDLPALYSGSMAFAYPSLYEGFGLPVLEAMACGTPVLTSQVSSLPEVCGDAAVYVHPLRTEEICRALLALGSDKDLRKALQARGLLRAQKFSWRESARKTLAVYESVAGRSGRRAATDAARSPLEVRP
jgi:glycosyltransferase involved in cell wall biosynthesis